MGIGEGDGLTSREERIRVLENLKYGDVLRYGTKKRYHYFFVTKVKDGDIEGIVHMPTHTSSIPIDNTLDDLVILRKEELPSWK